MAFQVRALEPVPGWRFGQWDRRDPRAILRRLIWRLAQERRYDGPVTTSWYLSLRFNHHLLADISQCTYVDGRYEPNEMYALSKVLGPDMCFIDVGANAGIYTLLAARLVGPAGAVHAFEPSPRDRQRLLANVSVNALSNVTVHASAVGRAPGTATLAVSAAERPGHNTLGGFAYADDARAYSVEVEVTTLDEFVRAQKLTRIDVLKIDVEGSELAVLQGAVEALRRFRPVIFTEASDPALRQLGASVSELLGFLREQGYELKMFGPSGQAEPLSDDRLTGLNLLCVPRPAR